MSYQVPQNIDTNKIFLVNRSEIEGRLDPKMAHYNKSVQRALYPMVKLKNLLLSKPQYGANEAGIVRENNTQPRYIRITDIDENGLISTNELGATATNVEEKYILKKNDILIARSGATVGKSYIHRELPYTCLYAGYLIRFLVNPDILLPEYLFAYTQLNPYKEWVNAIQRPSAQPNINAEEYQSLEIPLPNVCEQKEIIEYINEAYAKKQEKEEEAQQLIDSIDSYILEELGIILPKIRNDIKSRMFLVKWADLEDRLDPKFNKDYSYIRNLTSYYPWVTLKDAVLNTGQYGANESAKDYNIGDVRYIRITDIDEFGNLKATDKKTASNIDKAYSLKYNDVLFARSGSVGRCYIHKDVSEPAIYAGYLIRYSLNKNKIDPDYLFYYCNSKLYNLWVDTIQRPAVQANINAQEFLKLTLPLPPLTKQQEIVEHITAIRQQAKALQEEGKAILEQAKREVEGMIIG